MGKIDEILEIESRHDAYWRWNSSENALADYGSGMAWGADEHLEDAGVWFFPDLWAALRDFQSESWSLAQEIIRSGGIPVLVAAVADRIEDSRDGTVLLYMPREIARFALNRDEVDVLVERLKAGAVT